MNEEALKKLKDPKEYLGNFCKIKTKEGGLKNFVLNEAQKDLFNAIKKNNRVMILKARQMGFSTAATGYLYHYAITNPGVTVALIGYNFPLVTELLDKVKTFYRTTPSELRPTIHYNSKYEISFPKIDSKVLVLPSTENVGRGYTLNAVLLTELAAWEKAEEKMMTLEASVPINGKIIIESTPAGVGNLYHRMWMSEDNGYEKKMYGWWWGYSQEDIDKIRKRMNDPMRFAQEYGCEFLASGRSVFDIKVLKEQRANILNVGDKIKLDNGDDFTVYEEDGFTFYKPIDKNGLYIFGADVAEGVEGGDYSTACVWNRKTGEQVASYRGQIATDRFGELLDKWGRRFNNALMVVEHNSCGLTVILTLKRLVYPSMYFRPTKVETLGATYTDKLGWRTTGANRQNLIDEYAQALRDGGLIIHQKDLLDEMSVFVYDDNNNMVPHSSTFHDDCIFASAIGFQGFKVLYDKPLDQLNEKDYLPKSFSY